ncbi:MAG: hypothetical protein NC205_01180 [Prevotella sp.]|nr:hypothetical protein [Alistipes senegalensis]MCM1357177.1 hypothetical protein [Prevotella sp.]MCM1472549.1 hypothetical protein [Muribaculaceae bacterium]MDE6425971.1 hypothetical protein [Ruminococcus sp.]
MKILELLVIPVVLLLTGCAFSSSIDNLMSPPKLSVEQEQVYSALTDATGTSISLKYPKSGKYLSAFIVEDIDSDGESEAVVFYEKNSIALEENTLRINILDRSDGKWRSVCDTPAKGAEIEKVMISKLGSNDRTNLIIGSSLINRSEKNVSIYNYADGNIEETFSESYSFIDVTDLDGDEENEFLLLSGATSGSTATVETFRLKEDGLYYRYSCNLSGNFTEFDNLSYGKIDDERTGLYIDAVTGTGLIQTDIIYMDDNSLKKVFSTADESSFTVRPTGCTSFDIDGDGVPEIPVQKISLGYEEVSESEQIKITEWFFVGKNSRLQKKYTSYYDINDGYIFVFPEKWENHVTIKHDFINDEIVFCSYENGQTGRELLRLYFSADTPSLEDRISNGYMLLKTKGDSAYLAYIPFQDDSTDGLSVTEGDVAVGFRCRE